MSSCRNSSDANTDIEGIVLYNFDLNPVAARNFLDALEETCELLAEHPLIGRPRPRAWRKPAFVSSRKLPGFLCSRSRRH
jgi:plasmid stabilization system protein ParE